MTEFLISVNADDVIGVGTAKGKTKEEAKQKFLVLLGEFAKCNNKEITNPLVFVEDLPTEYSLNEYIELYSSELITQLSLLGKEPKAVQCDLTDNRNDAEIGIFACGTCPGTGIRI